MFGSVPWDRKRETNGGFMMSLRKIAVLLILAVLLAGALHAQWPATPAGRQFEAWIAAQDSLDRATIQEFLDKNMPSRTADQVLAIRGQTGGYDVEQVEDSRETRIVVMARQRGGMKQLVRITMNVAAAEPNQITGIQIVPITNPQDSTSREMTESEAAAARTGAPFRQFQAWLEAFNSGDPIRIGEFLRNTFPAQTLEAEMSFRNRTTGFDFRRLEQASPTTITGLMQARNADQFVRFVLELEPTKPYRIVRFSLLAVPRPTDFIEPRLSEPEAIAALDAKLKHDVAVDQFSGAVLLARLGSGSTKVLFGKAYGLQDREEKVENSLDTRFRIGSMTKMFTAVSILQLVQAGEINLTDPVGKYITDYPNKEVASKVTIHHLLTHTGGTGDVFGPELNAHRLEIRSHDDYIALLGKRAPAFEPGSRWAYSNYGMVLLGAVIERVSHQSYYDYVAEHVYKPAGMTRSGSEPESVDVPDRAIGYMHPQGATTWMPNTETMGYRGSAAGGSYSTVGDLLKFTEALLGHRLLSTEYTELLISGKVDADRGFRYSYGFQDWRKDGAGPVGHNGGAPGMNGELRIYPQTGYVVAVLSNLDPPAAQQVSAFLDLRLPQEPQAATPPTVTAGEPHPENAVPAIISLFDTHQVVAMDAAHRMKDLDDFILTLIRNPEFPDVVNDIVVECGNALYQPILDRYIAGEDVPFSQARQVWRNTMGMMCGVSAFYEQLFPLVRRINQRLSPAKRLRVIAADVPIDWNSARSPSDVTPFLQSREAHVVTVMENEVFAKHRKALLLFGIGHLVHGVEVPPGLSNVAIPSGAVARYERNHPGVTFVIGSFPGTCGTVGSVDGRAPQEEVQTWTVPSLLRTRGTTLPGAVLAGTLLIDAYLYLGSRDLALAEPHPADIFVDAEYMTELHRRAVLAGWLVRKQKESFAISWSIDPDEVREESATPFIFCRE